MNRIGNKFGKQFMSGRPNSDEERLTDQELVCSEERKEALITRIKNGR